MKSINNNPKNDKKAGWVGAFIVAIIALLIMFGAVFPLWYAFSVIPPTVTPVTVMALLGVGFFSRRIIIYAASFPRRVEMVRMIHRETKDINEIHLMHSSVSDKFFSWVVRIYSAMGALFCLEDVSDYADKAVMSIVGGNKRRCVLFCSIWLSATRIKSERGKKLNSPVKDIFCGTSAIPVPLESYDNGGPPKGYSVYALRMALDSLYHRMTMNEYVHPQDIRSLFYMGQISGAPNALYRIKGLLEFYDSVRGRRCGEYNIGGESAWSEGLKDGHFCGEKVDWVPLDIRVYSNAFSKLMEIFQRFTVGKTR